jgi:hypothetical protein
MPRQGSEEKKMHWKKVLPTPGVQNSVAIALFKEPDVRRLALRVGRVRTREKATFCCFLITGLGKKPNFFSPNPLENQHINTTPLIYNYSFGTKRFKRKERSRSIKGGVSPQPSLYNMFYFFCNLYLVTMSN